MKIFPVDMRDFSRNLNNCIRQMKESIQYAEEVITQIDISERSPQNHKEEYAEGCEWCYDEVPYAADDMKLALQHPLMDVPVVVTPNYCPMCGRKLKK